MMDIRAKRIQKFKNLKNHPWYGKHFKRLKKKDLDICMDWLEQFGGGPDFGHNVNRIFVENFVDRKQNPTIDAIIWELLSICQNPGGEK